MTRRIALWTGIAAVAVAAMVGALVILRPGLIVSWDDAWNLEMGEWRSDPLIGFALVMNFLGGGWFATFVVPLGIALVGLLRGWRASVYALAAFVASAAVVQLIKHLLGRPRPEDLLIASDFGSYPSGHTANAATVAIVLWFLFPAVATAIGGAVWVVAMGFSRTVLSVHWFSDTVGGALVGGGVALIAAAVLWRWVGRVGMPGEAGEDIPRDRGIGGPPAHGR
ncbi:phosphatase PAP2 family protein [Microbacterium panaciterrae]|uniref:Phosphatidic acid phosphatase type 2/haloperoxidase domain-containing protein n=1 Tax=Microbacterium panaciterrae TaxID=985759 RepID=A0ABP8PDL8_9MICO